MKAAPDRRAFLAGTFGLVGSSPALAQFLVGGTAVGRAYYVDGVAGNDGNNGLTPASAWKTISKVNTGVYAAGDRVLFKGGQTFAGSIVVLATTNYSGTIPPTTANPLVIGSYGGGMATISAAAGTPGFYGYDIGNYTVRDLIFTGSGGTVTVGVFADNDLIGDVQLPGVSFINLTISGFSGDGLDIGGDTGSSGFTGVLVQNCTVHDCTRTGIGVYGTVDYAHTNVVIDSCEVYNIPGIVATQSGNGITLGSVNGAVVTNCISRDSGGLNNSSNGPAGVLVYQCNAVVIKGCEIYNMTTGLNDAFGFDLSGGCSNCVIEYCYSHHNGGAGFSAYQYSGVQPWTNNHYRYNVSQNNGATIGGSGEFRLGGDSTAYTAPGALVYNNTCYVGSTGGVGFNIIRANAIGTIANNIIYTTSGLKFINATITPSASLLFRGNDYFTLGTFSLTWAGTTYTSYAAWQTATGQEKISGADVGHTGDPLLTSPGSGGNMNHAPSSLTAYQLQHLSPMIGIGLDMNVRFSINPGTLDFYGDTIPNGGGGTGFNVGADGANR